MSNGNYMIALYIRLSLEDDNDGESNSVTNQRDLLNDFVGKNSEFAKCRVVEFCDDGYSGTNFERPGIRDLLADIKKGNVSCIIVKDFSRFGRNYIEMGDYLEQVFPFLGIRFISVNDKFDSNKNIGVTGGIDVAFKNLIYDLYSKDLSQKVRDAKKAKMKKGDYLSPHAPFGYIKSKDNKNKLIIDDEANKIVKRIFEMVMVGMSTSRIAKILNYEGILTPLMYKEKNLCNRKWHMINEENFWTKSAVTRILRDQRYTGNMVNGKRIRPEVGNKRTNKLLKNEWIIVSNTHEAIISKEDFLKAQSCLKDFKERSVTLDKNRILYGKVRCGECGYAMTRKDTPNPYYFCATSNSISDSNCTNRHIPEKTIIEVLLAAIQNQIKLEVDADEVLTKFNNKSVKQPATYEKQIKEFNVVLEKLKLSKVEAYEKYKDNKINKEGYIKRREEYSEKIDEISAQISELEIDLQRLNKSKKLNNKLDESLKKYQFINTLSKDMVVGLIDKINIYDNDEIEIVWNFMDEYLGTEICS